MNFFRISILLTTLLVTFSCIRKKHADTIIHNAKVYTMDNKNNIEDAIAIKDGKIIAVGSEREILNKYHADEFINAKLKQVYPGFIDAHGHIMSYARQKLGVNLVECKSYDEMLIKIKEYQEKNNYNFIIGFGWNQSNWDNDEMPSNIRLNELFPDIPVCLFRIDGHALLANEYLIKKSNLIKEINTNPDLTSGGYLVYDSLKNFTGVMVDNAMNPILNVMPEFPEKELSEAIISIQSELISYGITGVHEAGLKFSEVNLFEKLIEEDKLKINIYAMLLPTKKNIEFARENGIYENKNLLIRSFKVFADGALGSRGACLKKSYNDKHGHNGYLITPLKRIKEIINLCKNIGYQMNTHAIGDSTNKLILKMYEDIYKINPDHRWRIEHAQIIDPKDIKLFGKSGAFPSVQPSHATSDQKWVESRLGENRIEGSYAYNSLLKEYGMIAIGTDFPVELTDPFLTIHSAINRKNKENFPINGFQANESITLEQCLRGMTTWSSYAAFQENKIGTIEVGKDATIAIFNSPVSANKRYSPNYAYMTFIQGEKVHAY